MNDAVLLKRLSQAPKFFLVLLVVSCAAIGVSMLDSVQHLRFYLLCFAAAAVTAACMSWFYWLALEKERERRIYDETARIRSVFRDQNE